MQWIFANLFLLAIILIGSGLLWAVGALMWALALPPDDHPVILLALCLIAIVLTYVIGKRLHRFVGRRIAPRL